MRLGVRHAGSLRRAETACRESPKARRTLDEKYEKLKGGLGKTTEAEVAALLGPAHNMTRPGKYGDKPDIEMRWLYKTHITVTFKDGKVTAKCGASFSEYVPVEKVTPENLRRVQPGMTEKGGRRHPRRPQRDRHEGRHRNGLLGGRRGDPGSPSIRTVAWSITRSGAAATARPRSDDHPRPAEPGAAPDPAT